MKFFKKIGAILCAAAIAVTTIIPSTTALATTTIKSPKIAGVKVTANTALPGVIVSWDQIGLGKDVTSYQIQVSTDKKFSSKSKVYKYTYKDTSNSSAKKKLSQKTGKLPTGKKYYARVRAYGKLNGKTIYTQWTTAQLTGTLKRIENQLISKINDVTPESQIIHSLANEYVNSAPRIYTARVGKLGTGTLSVGVESDYAASDFEIQISTKSSFASKYTKTYRKPNVIVSTKETSSTNKNIGYTQGYLTAKNLGKKATYYVRVRAKTNGVYSAWSKAYNFNMKKDAGKGYTWNSNIGYNTGGNSMSIGISSSNG